jgi:hypothetical protein
MKTRSGPGTTGGRVNLQDSRAVPAFGTASLTSSGLKRSEVCR